jgi:hypothetical protein
MVATRFAAAESRSQALQYFFIIVNYIADTYRLPYAAQTW